MFTVKINTDLVSNISDYQQKLPYALATALTQTAIQAEKVFRREITAVTRMPGRGGMGWVLRGLRTTGANKSKLVASVYFALDQAKILLVHETGGIKISRRGGTAYMAVPIAPELRKPGKRIPQNLQPKWLLGQGSFRPGHELGGGFGPLQDFLRRGERLAKGARIRKGRLKTFQGGFLVEKGGKLFIVTRLNKSELKWWYYLAKVVSIPTDHLMFKQTIMEVAQAGLQANFKAGIEAANKGFANRAARMAPVETATAFE